MPETASFFKKPANPTYEELLGALESGLNGVHDIVKAGIAYLDIFTFLLQHEGKPLSLDNYYMFRDIFHVLPPKRFIIKAGRQTAKTTSASAADIIERIIRANTKSLIVTPFFRQVHRISTEVAAPMISRSLFEDEILENSSQQVLKRRYGNGSVDHYGYAFQSVSPIRSTSGIDRLWVDEVQDMKAEFLPVIEQTQAGRPMTAWKWYTGTPLSMGNPIQKLWEESSQAVETIKCEACGKRNYGCVEEDLLKMIGLKTCVCAKCDKPLDVMKKEFIPRYPDREEEFPGRHISQILHPMHATVPSQWKELLRNREKYVTAQFMNEVCGESYDSADRMIDLNSLRGACILGPNTMEEALRLRDSFQVAGIGIDWTGGGESHSYTKLVFGGVLPGSSAVRVVFMVTLPKSLPIQQQIPEILHIVEKLRPDFVAHDFTGHGWVFETLGLATHLDKELLWPYSYGISPSREVVYANEAKTGLRSSLHLDHTRSLFALYSMIKAGRVLFPDWSLQRGASTGERPVDDFMHMYAESRPGLRSGEILYVRRDSGHSDDYVHATNFMATTCWYMAGSYPSVPSGYPDGARLVPTEEEAAGMEGEWMMKEVDDGPYVA